MKYDFIEKMGISSAYPTFDLTIKHNSTTHFELSIECQYIGHSDGTVINRIIFNKYKGDKNTIGSITRELKRALTDTILDNHCDEIIGYIIDHYSDCESGSDI